MIGCLTENALLSCHLCADRGLLQSLKLTINSLRRSIKTPVAITPSTPSAVARSSVSRILTTTNKPAHLYGGQKRRSRATLRNGSRCICICRGRLADFPIRPLESRNHWPRVRSLRSRPRPSFKQVQPSVDLACANAAGAAMPLPLGNTKHQRNPLKRLVVSNRLGPNVRHHSAVCVEGTHWLMRQPICLGLPSCMHSPNLPVDNLNSRPLAHDISDCPRYSCFYCQITMKPHAKAKSGPATALI